MAHSATPLTIYKASAGSGKTFTLVVEYLCLLVNTPTSHDQILAVTFTNKATEEMKMRIIGQLFGISRHLPDSESYLNEITKRTGKSREDIRLRCEIALNHILHHYNNFRIQTIDAFFQTVFRNMARELDLPPNMRIDLNDKQVEEKAVDTLISSLDTNSQVLSWIREYIDANIQEDKSWNVISEIKRFGENIFKDFYKNHEEGLRKTLGNAKVFDQFRKQLIQNRDTATTQWLRSGKALQELMEQSGFNSPDFFKFGSRGSVWSYIQKLGAIPNELSPTPANVRKFLDSPADNIKTDTGGQALVSFAENELQPQLEQFEKDRPKWWFTMQSARLALRNINQLRLLYAIDKQVKSMNSDANRFQLSNTQSLLKSFIQDSDSPFIYEKIGAYLRFIMIDEFQDTSRMQWDNFKVLLFNNMADTNSRNLIVGDVKQSIYRWRGGDWQLLNDISGEFADGRHNSGELVDTVTLDWNYRSSERIVNFNNIFFKHAVNYTLNELKNDGIDDYQQLEKAYEGHAQMVNRKDNEGYVRIEMVNDDKETYEETVLDSILAHVDCLIANGARQDDIAILLRRNRHIELIADTIMQRRNDLDVVSGEAFKLDASPAVNIIIDALTVLIHPDDMLTRHTLAKSYNKYVLKKDEDGNELCLADDINTCLPDRFVSDTSLETMPLTDLVDTLYDIFSLENIGGQGAYICKFNDILSDYVFDNTSDIQAFLTAWEDSLHSEKVQGDVVSGIRLLSIHKSKGLEYKHVIVPFCDWQIEQTSTIWCEGIQGEPYGMLPVIPVRYSRKSLMGTVFEQSYKKEHLQNVVDNMNLLYVAFTRAKKSLFVIGRRKDNKGKSRKQSESAASNNRSTVIEKMMELLPSELPDSLLTEAEDRHIFEWGELPEEPKQRETTTGRQDNTADNHQQAEAQQVNVFTTPEEPLDITLHTFPPPVLFRQSNKSREFIAADDESGQPATTNYIQLGNILHNLFAHIRTTEDIEPRLRELELEGILYDEELTADLIKQRIQRAMGNNQVRDWFSDRWKLYNERTILVRNEAGDTLSEYRPDRVMCDGTQTIVVDFKFGTERQEYIRQVQNYMTLLKRMGHSNVRGYLWYVMRNQIREVSLGDK